MAYDWQTLERLLDTTADQYGVPRDLARAVVKQESNWDINAVGDGGRARGWFQLHSGAAQDAGIDPARRHEPEQNILGGVRYLAQKLKQSGGNIDQALLRYNGGGDPNYVQHVRRHLPGGGREKPGLLARAWNALGPRSAEAAERPPQASPPPKWWETLPAEGERTAPSPAAPAPAVQKWWETLPPDTPQDAPQGTPAPAPAAGPSPGTPQPPTARSTPEEDAAYRQSLGQPEPPSDLTIDIEKESPSSGAPEGAATTVTPESLARAQLIEPLATGAAPPPPGQTLSERLQAAEQTPPDERPWWQQAYGDWRQGFTDRAMQSGAHPASPRHEEWLQSSPVPSTGTVVRELAATGIETGASVLGGVAGARGGPTGVMAGGALGQSYGRRLTNQLGLRTEEEPYATIAPGLKVYPSDVLNVGVGLLTGGWPMAKQLLGKSMAGKAILAAETETKAAYEAWQQAEKAATEAQQQGQAKAWDTAMGKARVKRMEYENKVRARQETIAANQAEYDAAEAAWRERGRTQILREEGDQKLWEQQAAEARTREYGTARQALEGTQADYQAQVAAREQQVQRQAVEDATTAQRAQTRAASEQDLYQRDVARARAQEYRAAEQAQAGEQRAYQEQMAGVRSTEATQQTAQQEAKQIPLSIKTGDKPAWQLYDDWRQSAQDVDVPLTQGKADLAALRAERPKTISGTPEPFAPEVERVVADLEKAGDTGRVTSVYEAVKKLGKLARSPNAAIRREAAQVGEVFGDILEQSPAANAQLAAARLAWRREAAQDTMQGWFKQRGVISTKGGREVLNADALFDKFKREMDKPLFAKSFTPEESQALYEQFAAMARTTPQMPSIKQSRLPAPRPELLPGATAATPASLPKPPPPRGLTAPTPPPPEIPAPQVETLPGAMADRPQGLAAPPHTSALPERPTPKALPPEERLPTATQVPYVEKADVGPRPEVIPDQLPSETKTAYEKRLTDFYRGRMGERSGIIKPIMGAGSVGALAFTLSRMGVSSPAIDGLLYGGAGAILANVGRKQADYFISKALLNPRLRPLLQASMENNTLNPRFYAAMLAVMTPEEKRDMPKELRGLPQKARR